MAAHLFTSWFRAEIGGGVVRETIYRYLRIDALVSLRCAFPGIIGPKLRQSYVGVFLERGVYKALARTCAEGMATNDFLVFIDAKWPLNEVMALESLANGTTQIIEFALFERNIQIKSLVEMIGRSVYSMIISPRTTAKTARFVREVIQPLLPNNSDNNHCISSQLARRGCPYVILQDYCPRGCEAIIHFQFDYLFRVAAYSLNTNLLRDIWDQCSESQRDRIRQRDNKMVWMEVADGIRSLSFIADNIWDRGREIEETAREALVAVARCTGTLPSLLHASAYLIDIYHRCLFADMMRQCCMALVDDPMWGEHAVAALTIINKKP